MALVMCAMCIPAYCSHTTDAPAAGSVGDIVRRHVLRFEAPPARIPAQCAVDAPLMGNGSMGVALSGRPESQVFYVARNDFWRLKSALDESFPLVLGKLCISIPELEGAGYHVEQHMYDATTTASFSKGDMTVTYSAYVPATADMLVVELGMEGAGAVKGKASISHMGKAETVDRPPYQRVYPGRQSLECGADGVQCLVRGFRDSVDIPTEAAMAMRVEGSADGTFTLVPGRVVRIVCATTSNFKSKECGATAVRRVKGFTQKKWRAIRKAHTAWWQEYWGKSYVSIPDSLIEMQYYRSLYGMGACSRDAEFPPSIFGTWITQEIPNWNGDYHLNYNHMAPYYALYSANRIEQADPFYAPLLAQVGRGMYYSAKITGIPDGILLPVGVGPLGIETTRRCPYMEMYHKDWIDSGVVEDEGCFWGQKSNSAYGVANISMQFYRTWDKDFARKVYPYVKGVASFWEKYLVFEDGRYVIYNDAIHEGTIGTSNPILSLGLVPMVMQTACDMSGLLGTDAGRRDKWQHVISHLSGYPTQQRNGRTVFRYTEKGCDWWGDNTLGIQHIYPAGQIGPDSDPVLLQTAYNTVDEMQRWHDFNGSNSFFPAAVRVGYDPEVILRELHRYSAHTYPNGMQLGNPHGIENFSTVPNTVNEMLCMGYGNVVRVFHAWPKDKDAYFSTIRVEGAFLVSGALKGGEVTHVDVTSEKGRMLTLQNPWPGHSVRVRGKGVKARTLTGSRLTLPTVSGRTYTFEKAD